MVSNGVVRDYNLMDARLVTPRGVQRANVALRGGEIAGIEEGSLPSRGATEIDLAGKPLIPGVIDPHVHLRDCGELGKETFTTGTACAAVGGVTTVMQMPNGIPDVRTVGEFRERVELIKNRAYSDIALYAWACDQNRRELEAFVELGAVAYKSLRR